jgi:hypothetical protein
LEDVNPTGFGARWLQVAAEFAVKGTGYADHGFKGEIVMAADKAAYESRLGSQGGGELAFLDAALLHTREHFLGELEFAKFDPVAAAFLGALEEFFERVKRSDGFVLAVRHG